MIVVCDASPIIALAFVDQLDLIDRLFDKVLIPQKVYEELTKTDKYGVNKIKNWARHKVIRANDSHLIQTYRLLLDAGESEAIALYWEQKADYLLIDEKKGRKIARLNGVNIVGTLGILLLAKQNNLLSEIKPLLALLQRSDIRISDTLYDRALLLANE
jgi:predicted nucleic acid-binding protein